MPRMLNEGFVINPFQDATVRYVLGIEYAIAAEDFLVNLTTVAAAAFTAAGIPTTGTTIDSAAKAAEFRLVVGSRIVDRWYDDISIYLKPYATVALGALVSRTVKLDGFVPAGEVARIDVVAPQGATISWLVNQETLHELIPDRFDPTGLFK